MSLVRLDVRLLGEFELSFGGAVLRLKAPPRSAELIAYLTLRRGTQISRASLATVLWPDETAETARANLRRHLHAITAALPESKIPWINATPTTVGWNPAAHVWADVWALSDYADDHNSYADAIALYRGELLVNSFDEWLLPEREALRAKYLNVCFESATRARRERDFDRALLHLGCILAADEWREDAVRLLMTVRFDAGDRAGALATFEQFAQRLRAEMKVDPMPETIALRDAILSNVLDVRSPGGEMQPPRARRNASQPFVGRVAELEQLSAAWTRAARGSGSTVFLGGPAGIGKSAMVAELAAIAQSQGGRVLLGTTSTPAAFPYEPVVNALRSGLPLLLESRIDAVWLSALAQVLPELHGVRADLSPSYAIEDEAARVRLAEAFGRAVAALARSRPLVLVLEDVHWATPSTVAIVEALARRIGASPTLLVVTYRTEEAGAAHPLSVLRRRLAGEHRAESLTLSSMREPEVEELISRLQPFAGASPSLAKTVYTLSEGNPLFVMQLLQNYAETGVLPDMQSAAKTIGAAIRSRIDLLDETSRTLIEAAATIGQSFSLEFVSRVLGWEESTVMDSAGKLLDRSIVRETGGDLTYSFTHALIAATVYDGIPEKLRVARHRRIAQLLRQLEPVERGNEDLEHRRMLATIARHYELAGEHEIARSMYLRAARAAFEVYALEEAASLARNAYARSVKDTDRFEAMLVAVLARESAGDATLLERDLGDLQAASTAAAPHQRFELLRIRARVLLSQADALGVHGAIASMAVIVKETNDPLMSARLLEVEAMTDYLEGRLVAAQDRFNKLVEDAQAAGDPNLASYALTKFCEVSARMGDLPTARRAIDSFRSTVKPGADINADLKIARAEAMLAFVSEDRDALSQAATTLVALAEAMGDIATQGVAHGHLAYVELIKWNIDSARAHYATTRTLLERCGRTQNHIAQSINAAMVDREVGHLDRAIATWKEVRLRSEALGLPSSTACCAINVADAELARGNVMRALECSREANEVVRIADERRFQADAFSCLGASECAAGDADAGLAHLYDALALRRETEQSRSLSTDLCRIIDALLHVGQRKEARRFAHELAAIYDADAAAILFPNWVCKTLESFHSAAGEPEKAEQWRKRDAAHFEFRTSKLNEEDRLAYAALYTQKKEAPL